MAGVEPVMLKEPTVKAPCKSKVALLIVSWPETAPAVPVPVIRNVPAEMVVPPL